MRTDPPSKRLRRLASAVACLPVLLSGAAIAGPYSVGVQQTVTQESNLMRLETGAPLPDGVSRSDTVWTTELQGGIDQPIGRQRVFGQASLRHTRFARNGAYDNDGYRVRLGAEGSTAGRLEGSLSVSLQRNQGQLSNDESGVLTRSNTEQLRQVESALRWGASARLAAEASLEWRSVDFSAPTFASRAFRQGAVYAGLRHSPSAALWWSVGWRETDGRYPKFRRLTDGSFEGDHYRRRELELRAALKPSGASEFQARLGLGRTSYDNATARDISGVFGAFDWTWRPTGALRLRTHVSRDPSQDSYFLNTLFGRGTLSYDRQATTWQWRADMDLTGKTALYLAWGWTDRSLVRNIEVAVGTLPGVQADDRTWQLSTGLRWQPLRTLLVGVDLVAEQRREASALSRPYRSTAIATFGQLTLEP